MGTIARRLVTADRAITQCHAAAGDAKAAEESIRKALDNDPANLAAYEALGRLYVKANRLQEAIVEFEALAARQPHPVAALTMVGMIQESMRRTDEARRTYQKALEFDPNAAVAGNNLAWIYVNNGGNLDVALQLAKNAKSTLPKQAEIADTLGWVYYKKGLWPLAIRELKEAVDRDPSNPMYHYHLGAAYASGGSKDLAKKALNTALSLRPDFDGAQDATRLLSTL